MNLNEFKDEFRPFLGLVTCIVTEKHGLPLYGRLVAVSQKFLTVEKRDGKRVLISKKAVMELAATKDLIQDNGRTSF